MSLVLTVANGVWLKVNMKIDKPITEILRRVERPSGVYAGVQYPKSMFDLRDAIQMQAFESVRAGA